MKALFRISGMQEKQTYFIRVGERHCNKQNRVFDVTFTGAINSFFRWDFFSPPSKCQNLLLSEWFLVFEE